MTDQELTDIIQIKTAEGVRFGNGWFSLVKDLYNELLNNDWDGNFSCVKEKYGVLKFYLSTCHSEFEKIIERYEKLSVSTCDICGEPGRLIDLHTICAKHYVFYRYRYQKEFINHKNLIACKICGYISIVDKECTCCNFTQWNPTNSFPEEEWYKIQQIDWYSYIRGIDDQQISPLPKSPEHIILFTADEINNYEYITEFDF